LSCRIRASASRPCVSRCLPLLPCYLFVPLSVCMLICVVPVLPLTLPAPGYLLTCHQSAHHLSPVGSPASYPTLICGSSHSQCLAVAAVTVDYSSCDALLLTPMRPDAGSTFAVCSRSHAATRGFPPPAPRISQAPRGFVERHVYFGNTHTKQTARLRLCSLPLSLQLWCPFIQAASAADWLPTSQQPRPDWGQLPQNSRGNLFTGLFLTYKSLTYFYKLFLGTVKMF